MAVTKIPRTVDQLGLIYIRDRAASGAILEAKLCFYTNRLPDPQGNGLAGQRRRGDVTRLTLARVVFRTKLVERMAATLVGAMGRDLDAARREQDQKIGEALKQFERSVGEVAQRARDSLAYSISDDPRAFPAPLRAA
ncbi:hypothetical protein M885DRAFT_570256 [Pelagophyceae sp. CCMP2097]|nr:hypothetical protein M885DRAFT_570256 [Pelagophyceae sp. CCMP2097]